MDLLSRDEIAELARTDGRPCVSVFMPTQHVEAEVSQNPIRLKNLIKQVRHELEQTGYRASDIESFIKPLSSLVENSTFWLDEGDGFAAFLTHDTSTVLRLPLEFEELVVTGSRFHLKPLFPLMAVNNRFYLLALSKNDVKLYQGTHYAVSEVETTEFPKSLIEVIYDEVEDRSLQFHTGNVAGGRHDAIFHGHGVTSDDADHRPHDKLVRFFREIDHGLRDTLNGETAPLVLAGVEYYLPLYKEVNGYKNLVQDTILAGNPDHLKPRDLHGKAWKIVEPIFLEAQKTAVEGFQHLHGNGEGQASVDIRDIVPGAKFGRVDVLLVEIGAHTWGRYDEQENTLELHAERQPGDDDLLDYAAIQAFLQGGRVHALKPETMPIDGGIAATFRFPMDVAAEDQSDS